MTRRPDPARHDRGAGRRLARVALRGAALGGAMTLALCASAAAALVSPASLSMTSEPGDYVGQGGAYHYAAPVDAFNTVAAGPAMRVNVAAASGEWWNVMLAAPDGRRLAPGVYDGATRYPFQAAGVPGLSVSGNGRGCNALTGSFEVYEATYAADGSLTRLHATFAQHCEGMPPNLIGSIELGESPPPPPLAIVLTLNPTGAVNALTGAATIGGTVTCSRGATVSIGGTLEQWRGLPPNPSRGTFARTTTCATKPVAWTSVVKATTGPAFAAGQAKLVAAATGEGVTESQSATIVLQR